MTRSSYKAGEFYVEHMTKSEQQAGAKYKQKIRYIGSLAIIMLGTFVHLFLGMTQIMSEANLPSLLNKQLL